MNNPALPQAKNRGRPATVPAPLNAREKAEKNCSRLKPRNLLKSLDSNERIQRNPTKSNPHDRGPRSETATSQENPNGSTGPTSRPAAEKEPNRLHPNAKRPKGVRRRGEPPPDLCHKDRLI